MTKKVGVIGFPIEHSLSPAMHNAAFKALGMDWQYDKLAIPPDIVGLSLRELHDHGYVRHQRDRAAQAGGDALREAGRDRAGGGGGQHHRLSHQRRHQHRRGGLHGRSGGERDQPAGMRVVVLGAGGAARAAVYGLSEAGARIVIVNRTVEKARDLIDSLRARAVVGDASAVADAELIVNCTSVGLPPNADQSALPNDAPIPAGVTLYDMVYRPAKTKLMGQVEAAGGRSVGGLGMLVRQGAAAFKLWTGVEPPLDVMRAAARRTEQTNIMSNRKSTVEDAELLRG